MKSDMVVSLIIPAYNEGKVIGSVLKSIQATTDHEVIVVDDGSSDNTAQVAESLGVRVIRHRRNKGYGAALKTGVRAARGEVIVTLDADGQHQPLDIARLLDYMGEYECDMVVGARQGNASIPWVRRPGKWLLSLVANYLAGVSIPDLNSGFRAIRRDLICQNFHILPDGFSFSTTLTLAMLKGGYEVAFVPIVPSERSGQSSVNIIRDGMNSFLLSLRTVMLFDPLKVFLPVALGLLLVAMGYTLYTTLTSGLHIPSGAIVLFVSSVVVFMFGLLADQLSAVRRERR